MPFAGVDDLEAFVAPGAEQAPIRFNGAPELRDIVSEHFPEAAGLEKVSLHIDDEERAVRWVKIEVVRFRGNRWHVERVLSGARRKQECPRNAHAGAPLAKDVPTAGAARLSSGMTGVSRAKNFRRVES
jgi:hypothetical protein